MNRAPFELCGREKGLAFLLLHEAAELVIEARDAAAAVEQLLVAAGPGRVRLRIDIERQSRAFFTVGRTGLEGGAVGHLDRDHVVSGMAVGLHDRDSWKVWGKSKAG